MNADLRLSAKIRGFFLEEIFRGSRLNTDGNG